ncbi:hypothetical protein JAAARDRAFT_270508 [Jaapia argillacea MUCL 33604]|uniref:Uncharacterized protein n=1 Tax=Jaapia argillacea MUCL 33604 TaxID=933084 RepID=A0A067PUT8_9AGAM|nr:hypothetical protein JAAARDRAFT_270508 [Jaapia argillacea MUCL 33604]
MNKELSFTLPHFLKSPTPMISFRPPCPFMLYETSILLFYFLSLAFVDCFILLLFSPFCLRLTSPLTPCSFQLSNCLPTYHAPTFGVSHEISLPPPFGCLCVEGFLSCTRVVSLDEAEWTL